MTKKFSYKFSATTILLAISGLILSIVCILLNVSRLIKLTQSEIATTTNYLSCGLAIFIGALAFVIITAYMLFSNYRVTDSHFVVSWGIIKSKYEISKITRVTFFRVSGKLVVFCDENTFVNVCIKKEEYDELVNALKGVNKSIFYSLDSENKGE